MVKGSELHKAAIRYKRKMYNQELLKTSGALINTANGREDTIVFTFLGNQYSNNLKRKKAYSLKDARWQPYHISTIKKLQMIARNEVRKLHERMPKS